MIEAPATVPAPARLWRIGRGDAPLAVRRPAPDDVLPRCGNRFDSSSGDFGALCKRFELQVF